MEILNIAEVLTYLELVSTSIQAESWLWYIPTFLLVGLVLYPLLKNIVKGTKGECGFFNNTTFYIGVIIVISYVAIVNIEKKIETAQGYESCKILDSKLSPLLANKAKVQYDDATLSRLNALSEKFEVCSQKFNYYRSVNPIYKKIKTEKIETKKNKAKKIKTKKVKAKQ